MALANYSDLQAAIANWLDGRDDLTATIPDFIALCEARLNRSLRCREMEDTETLVPSSGVCTLPTDFIEARQVKTVGSPVCVLEAVTPDYADNEYPTATSTGYPNYYSISGASLRTHPPSTASITLIYYQKIPALASSATNWLLTKAPGAYLYGSLMEAAPYLGDDMRIQTWGTLYEREVSELNAANVRAMYSRARARVSGPRP